MSSRTVLRRFSICGFSVALVLLSLICGRAAPPAPTKPAAPPVDIANQLQGTWHFRWPETGFNADFLFRADGTFLAVDTQREGTWKVVGGQILMEQPNLEKKQISLPIDPKGTKVHDDRKNRTIIALKREMPAPGAPSPPIAITPATPPVPANKAVVTTPGGTTSPSEARERTLDPPKESSQPRLQATTPLGKAREFPLGSRVHDLVAGAGGRFLVLHLADIRKLAIFDVVDLKVRGYINLAAEPALIAAGWRHILVGYPDQNSIHRYSAETLALERTISSPFSKKLTNLVMGYSSPRTAFLCSEDSETRAFDTETMALKGSLKPDPRFPRLISGTAVIRASADGHTYGFYAKGVEPSGFNIVTFRNGELSRFNEHVSAGLLLPNSDGSLIFTTTGIYTPKYVPVLQQTDRSSGVVRFFPSYHPAYFFAVPMSQASNGRDGRPKPVAIYLRGFRQPLGYLPEAFEEMDAKDTRGQENRNEPITMEKRYHFYPQLNLFLTIPQTNDKIVSHPVDVRQILAEKGIDYLYVTSIAPPAKLGAAYRFHLEAASKAGGVTFALQSGPEGLTVSADGNVAWTVPSNAGEESVIVSVKDASGQEILHTFQIATMN